MKKIVLGLLTLTALGAISFPVQADEGDSAVVQDARQTTYQTGDHNYSGQSSVQKNRVHQNGRSNSSTGDVMTSDQLVDQYGTRNRVQQRIQQENNRSRNSRPHTCNSGCDHD